MPEAVELSYQLQTISRRATKQRTDLAEGKIWPLSKKKKNVGHEWPCLAVQWQIQLRRSSHHWLGPIRSRPCPPTRPSLAHDDPNAS